MTTYYRYILDTRQSGQWHHRNPDLARWHRQNIDETVSLEAVAAGYDEWVIFDADETLLAQGMTADHLWVD